jgi:hypothetical protein
VIANSYLRLDPIANSYLRLDPREWIRAVEKRRVGLRGGWTHS